MKVAILGGTGQTGGELIRQALAGGHSVVALARQPEAITTKHERLSVVAGDGTRPADVARVVTGVDAVVVAVGPKSLKTTTLRTDVANATVSAMKDHGITKLVWLSAFGVGDSESWAKKSIPLRLFMRFVLRTTYVDAASAEAVVSASGLDFVLLRPPRLTNGTPRGSWDVASPPGKLPRYQVTRADVAAFMLQAAQSITYDRTFPVVC